MIDILGRKKKKEQKEKDEEFQRARVITEEAKPSSSPLPPEYLASLGTAYYLLVDNEVSKILKADPKLKPLIPAFSPLNRTTNIGKNNVDVALDKLNYEFLMMIHELSMDEDTYETTGWATLEALKMFAMPIISDKVEGFRGRLITEQIKVIKTVLEREKRKWL